MEQNTSIDVVIQLKMDQNTRLLLPSPSWTRMKKISSLSGTRTTRRRLELGGETQRLLLKRSYDVQSFD